MVNFCPTGTPKTESTHEYCPCAPVALSVPSIRWATHSDAKVAAIPGVSRCARGALVVVQAAITPGEAGFYGQATERALGGRLVLGRKGIGQGAPIPTVTAGVDLAGVPQVPPVEIRPERVEKDQFGISRLPEQEVRKPLLAG